MSIEILKEYISQIKNFDSNTLSKARARLDVLAKPPGSLGKLEDIAARLAGISGEMFYDVSYIPLKKTNCLQKQLKEQKNHGKINNDTGDGIWRGKDNNRYGVMQDFQLRRI